MNKNLGNSMHSTGNRVFKITYDPITKEKASVLLTWIDKRCRCGKFLSKKQQKYCSKCAHIEDKKLQAKCVRVWKKRTGKNSAYYRSINPEVRSSDKLRNFICYHADSYEVGQIIV